MPAVALAVITPLPPLHAIAVVTVPLEVNAVGWFTTMSALTAVQPLLSVVLILYVPAVTVNVVVPWLVPKPVHPAPLHIAY